MAVGYGPSIVTNSLVLMLDAANPRCALYNAVSLGTMTDLSGRNYSFTNTGGGTQNVDANNNLLWYGYNGTTQYYRATGIPTYAMTALTVSAWVNPNNFTAAIQPVLAHTASLTDNSGWRMVVRSTGTVGFSDNAGAGADNYISTSAALTALSWQMMSVTISGTSLTFWVNDRSYDSTTTGAMAGSPVSFQIARDSNTTPAYYGGAIGPMMVYNRALSAAEMAANFAAYRGRFGI